MRPISGWPDAAWLAASVAASAGEPVFGDLSATMVITVIGRPGGDVSFVQVLDAGQVADARLGDDKDAQVTWTVTAEVARQLAAGELDPSVAFMQGRLKTAGHPGLVLDVLAATATAPFRAYRERLAEAGRPAPDAA